MGAWQVQVCSEEQCHEVQGMQQQAQELWPVFSQGVQALVEELGTPASLVFLHPTCGRE